MIDIMFAILGIGVALHLFAHIVAAIIKAMEGTDIQVSEKKEELPPNIVIEIWLQLVDRFAIATGLTSKRKRKSKNDDYQDLEESEENNYAVR